MAHVRGVDARGRAPFWTARIVDGEVTELEPIDELAGVLEPAPDVDVLALDVALGHESPGLDGEGLRACDVQARELLGEAADRVFWTPPYAVLEAQTLHEAVEICEERGWPRIETPLWHARDRLRELREAAGREERLVEVHPEVSFTVLRAQLGGRGPMEHYGDTWAAMEERLSALNETGLHPEGLLEAHEDPDPRQALDATVAAWTAERVAGGQARTLPEDPPVDPGTNRPVALYA